MYCTSLRAAKLVSGRAHDERGVGWRGGKRMAGLDDFNGRMHSLSRHVGVAGGANRSRRLRLTMLPHALVPRACPVVKASDEATRAGRNKLALWKSVLTTATVLHCFPPESMPEDKRVVMGSKEHIHGEVVFDQRQGLWFMARGWEAAIAAPKEKDFFRGLAQQHNGLRAGQAVPPA